ncbi:glycolipid transfer protein 3-like isoform X3 [Alnus glutinosa]|uniref:glycolipid transfer protein 3-like isoform X3 n=1 Tax=Alnus glutinosa TaxID=3517 RepID=UPI002D7820A2|nr:glycolipid transfer protein 3-like isoform X3 [Alnus glutinosa]
MKRKRELEKVSEIKSAIEELSVMVRLKPGDNHDAAHIPTKPFLHVCNSVLQVLDKIGPTMAVLRQDIHQNIQKEASEGNARKNTSSSKAVVWLTRAMDFTLALLQKLATDPEQSMEEAVEESYNITLKPWHGWISSAAFKVVALKLVPDNKTFTDLLMGKDGSNDTLKEETQTLITLLSPFLEEIHSIMRVYKMDKVKST